MKNNFFQGLVFSEDISKYINEPNPSLLFGVFDGHGGADCMTFLKENLIEVLIFISNLENKFFFFKRNLRIYIMNLVKMKMICVKCFLIYFQL